MTNVSFPERFDLPEGSKNPFEVFKAWLKDAERTELSYPTAMQLATVGADGMPSIRTVLMRGMDERGLCFYTNSQSRKGEQIAATGKAAALFYWKSQMRQIHIEGAIVPVEESESDAYFASRPYGHKISSMVSQQSRPLESREALMARVKAAEAAYPQEPVPRPAHWHGYRIIPARIEFWQEGKHRLHDRYAFTRTLDGGWDVQRLNP